MPIVLTYMLMTEDRRFIANSIRVLLLSRLSDRNIKCEPIFTSKGFAAPTDM